MKPPAFQFYPSDFMMGTCMMTSEEVGAYIRLLCIQWDVGALPNDDATLSRLGGCGGIAVASVRSKFEVSDDGKLRNTRLEQERAKQRAYRDKQAENGAKRWVGNAKPHAVAKPSQMPNAMPNAMPNGCSPSLSSSSDIKEASPPCGTDAEKAPKKPRARNLPLEALVSLNGERFEEVTDPAWGRAAKALQQITAVCPEVTAEEIRRRAANYGLKWPGKLTSTALAAHWAEFDRRPQAVNQNGEPQQPARINIVQLPLVQ